MRITIIFALLLSVLRVSAQQVVYYLPKKIIYITVPFTIVEKKAYKVDSQTGQMANEPEKILTTVKVNGDIKVVSKLFPDASKSLNLDVLGKGGKIFNFDITFDDKGNGMISTINASQTPVTADIIKGTVNIVGSVIKLGTNTFGMVGGDEKPDSQEITTEQNIEETRVIELTNNDPFSLTIEPSTRVNVNTIAGTKPSVDVKITKISKEPGVSTGTTSLNSGVELHYRIPAEHSIQVIVKNNQLIKEQMVINERILVPQTGNEITLLIPILKKHKTVDIGFNEETGNLSKYGLKKESQISENTQVISDAIGTLNTETSALRTAMKNQKEKEEEEGKKKEEDRKKKEEENRNKDIKDEIESLNLEKDRLDLIIEKQKLKKQVDAMKKDANTRKIS